MKHKTSADLSGPSSFTNKNRSVFLSILLISALFFSAGCFKEKKIKIAIMTKFQSGSLIGSSEINAAKLFLEDKKISNIEIVPYDDGWDPEKTKSAYSQVKRDGIGILITSHTSTCATTIMDDINRDKILTFATGTTTDVLSARDDFIFRDIQDVRAEQKSIAEYIKRIEERDLVVVRDTDNSGYTNPAIKYFREAYKRSDLPVIDISMSKLDLLPLEKEIRKHRFKVIYLLIGGYQSASGNIAQLAKKINPKAKIIFTPWMKTPLLLETAGSAIKDSVIPSHYPPRAESPEISSYIDHFKSKYGYAPTFISINVYIALQILEEAINEGNTTPKAIREFILKKRTFKTDFGEITFDQYGEIKRELYFITDLTKEF